MTSFVLKILACISMFFDHFAYLFTTSSFTAGCHLFGRLAFPIFAFQLTEGYTHTKNTNKYLLRLFILALISQIPFTLYFENFPTLNIFFTLFLGLLAIHIYSNFKYKSVSIILVGVIAYVAYLLNVDYSYYGVLLIFVFYLFKNNKTLLSFAFITLTLIFYISWFKPFTSYVLYLYIATISALIPILLYNGKQGKKVKYLFYMFYPIHLILLCILKLII